MADLAPACDQHQSAGSQKSEGAGFGYHGAGHYALEASRLENLERFRHRNRDGVLSSMEEARPDREGMQTGPSVIAGSEAVDHVAVDAQRSAIGDRPRSRNRNRAQLEIRQIEFHLK